MTLSLELATDGWFVDYEPLSLFTGAWFDDEPEVNSPLYFDLRISTAQFFTLEA